MILSVKASLFFENYTPRVLSFLLHNWPRQAMLCEMLCKKFCYIHLCHHDTKRSFMRQSFWTLISILLFPIEHEEPGVVCFCWEIVTNSLLLLSLCFHLLRAKMNISKYTCQVFNTFTIINHIKLFCKKIFGILYTDKIAWWTPKWAFIWKSGILVGVFVHKQTHRWGNNSFYFHGEFVLLFYRPSFMLLLQDAEHNQISRVP